MKSIARLFVFAVAIVLPTRALAAKPLITPVVSGGWPAAMEHRCTVLNIGSPVTVTIEVVNADTGFVYDSLVGVTALPFDRWSVSASTLAGVIDSYCRVTGISKNKVRITHCVVENSGLCGSTVTLP